jgi:LysM repeat protein
LVITGPGLFLIAGALIVVILVRSGHFPSSGTPALAPSISPSITFTSLPTNTEEPTLTPTPLPPIQITVEAGKSCIEYGAIYHVNPNAIIELNNLSVDCFLREGASLLIPQPTLTQPPPATRTFNSNEQTKNACDLFPYVIKDGDTLFGLSISFNVPQDSILKWNPNISGTNLPSGVTINIPLCERNPTQGPSPTPTVPPPYPAPNLLLPKDGAVYGASEQSIALQWAAITSLRETEAYKVTILDMSSGDAEPWVDYVTDTLYRVPVSLRPTDNSTHIFQWYVTVVRKTGTTDAGKPIYVSAGAVSERRVFAWGGTAPVIPTSTPSAP